MSDLGNKKIMAENIQYYMALNHKERYDLCRDLGFKYTTLCDWLKAKTYPRIDKIEMLANYFGIEKADLVERREANLGEANPRQSIKQRISQLSDANLEKVSELVDLYLASQGDQGNKTKS